jgi:hypothetical protein
LEFLLRKKYENSEKQELMGANLLLIESTNL